MFAAPPHHFAIARLGCSATKELVLELREPTASTWTDARARAVLQRMFAAAVASADPARIVSMNLPDKPLGRCVVVGAGKAAASMAAAIETAWPDVPMSGVVATPYGYRVSTTRIRVIEAAHPVPDENSVIAAQAALMAVRELDRDDLVIAVISGGGSSVLVQPADGLSLADKQVVNRLLLSSGLDIRTMNAVRRRLSAIKGGRLAAAAAPARVVTLAISDIPGDDPSAIASGPTVADRDWSRDLTDVVAKLSAGLPDAARQRLLAPPMDFVDLAEIDFQTIATSGGALQAAADLAAREGLATILLGDDLEGESRDLGAHMAALAGRAASSPVALISGGETTVTLGSTPPGCGGRNTEFLLSFAINVKDRAGVWALAADTDGQDGTCPGVAGAIATPDTLARARQAGLDAGTSLAAHDSGTFFSTLGDLVITGPTFTNVNDFRAIVVTPNNTVWRT